jgi:predicted RNA-binding protein with PUA-like domain
VKNCWLVKQEPDSYPFEQFAREKETNWEGVRNFQARNNLRAMRRGDPVLFYASGELKAVVGTATVAGAPYPDPTADEGDWTAVKLRAGKALARPVTLAEIKATPALADMLLVRNSRLSVMPVTLAQYAEVIAMGTK